MNCCGCFVRITGDMYFILFLPRYYIFKDFLEINNLEIVQLT